jgi:hypothetical protein
MELDFFAEVGGKTSTAPGRPKYEYGRSATTTNGRAIRRITMTENKTLSPRPRRRRWELIAAVSTALVVAACAHGAVFPLPSSSSASAPPVATLDDPGSNGINAISFSSSGGELLTCGLLTHAAQGGTLFGTWLWNPATGKEISTGVPADADGSLAARSPDGSTLAFGTVEAGNPAVDWWSIADRRPAATTDLPASAALEGANVTCC